MTTRNIYDLAQTWNDGATDFTAIKMNVTDTASAATSKLLDLQVGGSSKASISKDGTIKSTTSASPFFMGRFRGDNGGGIGCTGSGNPTILAANSSQAVSITGTSQKVWANYAISWANKNNDSTLLESATADLFVCRDAANTLAQRNGANAQAFNIYNTYTDASNYECGFMKWNSNVLEIGTQAAGTGTVRNVGIYRGASLGILLTSGQGNYYGTSVFYGRIRGNNTAVLELAEMLSEPSGEANYAKVYALDDGTGKTKLMVRFGSGSPIQLAIEP